MGKSRNDELNSIDENQSTLRAEREARRKRRAIRQSKRDSDSSKSTSKREDIHDGAVTAKKESITLNAKAAEEQRERANKSSVPIIGGAIDYMDGVRAEIEKVTWPTREEAVRLTRIVILVSIAFSIMLGLFDAIYGLWFELAVDDELAFLGIGAIIVAVGGGFSWRFILREEV